MINQQPDTAKVNAARRQPNIKILWPQWLYDSIALWQRLDEPPYLIDLTSFDIKMSDLPSRAESSDREFNGEDEDIALIDGPMTGSTDVSVVPDMDEVTSKEISNIDWGDATRELEEYLGDEDGISEDGSEFDNESSVGSGTEGELTEEEGGNMKLRKRSRSHSRTSQESRTSVPGSPLQKRQKLAANRKSKLKVSFEVHHSDRSLNQNNESTEDDDSEDFDSLAEELAANF